jgi:tRNA modification GTPase
MDWLDTIVAGATATGDGCRAIVRVAGPNAHEIVAAGLIEPPSLPWRRAQVFARSYLLPRWSDRRVPARVYVWPERASATDQPAAEIHAPAGPALANAVVATLCERGARLARPGEFTLRTFLAGRLDLSQAEGVLGLIEARDVRDLALAIDERSGGLSAPVGRLRNDLLDLLADLEAGLDFVDEDIEFVSAAELIDRLEAARREAERLGVARSGRRFYGAWPRVVLVGPPNAGKSTLFNALVGRSEAIVSPHAGTTTDYLSAVVEFDGVAVELIDTAGFDPGVEGDDGGVFGLAAKLRRYNLHTADLEVLCLPNDEPAPEWWQDRPYRLTARTKADRAPDFVDPIAQCTVSAVGPPGVDPLVKRIRADLASHRERPTTAHSDRCVVALTAAVRTLDDAIAKARAGAGTEYVAVGIRETLDLLGEIVGAVYTDDLLDRIFSRFCIGK